jgi:CHAT domain-containing protein
MVDPHTNGCPQPEVLAAYVDRGLSLSERARVDAHLASCPQCIALIAGVARTVVEVSALVPDAVGAAEATPFVTRRSLAGAVAAAAAVLAIVAAPSFVRPWLERDAGLVSLVDSVGEQRSVLGRLTGGFPHAPLGVPSAGGQDGRTAGADRVQLTAGKIRESFGEYETPSQLHALGISQLLARRYDDAAQSLLAASREQPANAQYLSDVAAVQLERARLGLRPDDLPRALAAADRARRLDPSLKEAWFNRALAVSALSLTAEAKTAWTEYLKRDSVSPWAAEARARLADLAKPTPAQAWLAIETNLQQTFGASTADDAVRAQTTEARNLLENKLLVSWANAVLAGRSGTQELERVRVMAQSMLRLAGDALYVDAVSAIDRASTNRNAVMQLAQGHRDYANAAVLFSEDRFAAALPSYASSHAAFGDSSLGVLATVQEGAIAYVSGRASDAERILNATLATARSKGYAYASARSTWFLGLVAMQQGRIGEAETRYEETVDTLERMKDAEQVAGAHGLLSALHFYLGNATAEWEHRIASLEGLSISTSFRFRHAILSTAAISLAASNPESALVVHDAVIENARAWGRDSAIADAVGQRASALVQLGRSTEADQSLSLARQHLDRVPDPQFKNRLEVALLSVRSDLMRRTNPAAAVAAARDAIVIVERRRDRLRLAQLQLKLAQANIVWGKTGDAEAALRRGIDVFEEERRSLSDEGRISARDESWGLFEAATELAIKRNDLELAFTLSERARTRSLAEARRQPLDRTLVAIRKELGAQDAIVALNQFDDELAIWIIRRDRAEVITRPLSRLDSRRLVARQQDEIWQQAQTPSASRELFNQLLRPVADQLKDVARLIVVPDPTFENASFPALWDQSKGRFLVESVAVDLAPSAGAFMSAATEARANGTPLIFSGPGTNAQLNARAMAEAYQQTDLMVGPNATRGALFAGATGRRLVHISAPTTSSQSHPLLSRLTVSDDPGMRHSGAILGSDIAARSFGQTTLVILDEAAGNSNRGEGTLSLARAFMAAGVPAVLGTLPGADENATRDLMIGFHSEMNKGVSAEQALTTVQRNAIQQNGRRLGAWSALVLYGSDR